MNKDNVNKIEEVEFDEQDKKIYDAFIELGWLIPQTEEEVQRAEKTLENAECPPLPNGLADSSKILERIRKRLVSDEKVIETKQISNVKPFLGYVSDATGLPPSKIEQELGLPTEFLIQIPDNAKVVNETVRENIVSATLLKFPQLDRNVVLQSLKQPSQKMAAARNEEYSHEEITFEKILDSSGMTDKEFWLKLNEESK
jgi:hypothetical protein